MEKKQKVVHMLIESQNFEIKRQIKYELSLVLYGTSGYSIIIPAYA